MAQRFAADGAAVCAHVYADAARSPAAEVLEKRVAEAAAARFGAGSVRVSARGLAVETFSTRVDLVSSAHVRTKEERGAL